MKIQTAKALAALLGRADVKSINGRLVSGADEQQIGQEPVGAAA